MPSSEKFVDSITPGLAYGMLPDQQSADLLAKGRLVDLASRVHLAVKLYWHCWHLKSGFLKAFTDRLIQWSAAVVID